MAKRPLPPIETLRQLLRYEPGTGKLFWREIVNPQTTHERFMQTKFAGKEAIIADNGNGYKVGRLRPYRKIYAHRVIWAIVHGEWPEQEIDHINGIRDDNRLCNLREVTRSQNGMNVAVHRDTLSGIKGAYYWKGRGWFSRISKEGKSTHLGLFATKEDAAEAYRKAAIELHGDHSGIYRP